MMTMTAEKVDRNEVSVACARVQSGNGRIEAPIALPGLRGVVRCSPSDGGRGGDVYFLSVCGSGLLTRVCLADIAGHGASVEALGRQVHGLLERHVNRPDHRRFLTELNDSLMPLGLDAMTTAVVFTYYPPTRAFSFTYAGHPPGWYYRAREESWSRLVSDETSRPSESDLVNGVLGVSERVAFTRSRLRAEPGDQLLLVTDGVLETPSPERALFGASRLERLLAEHTGASPEALTSIVVDALSAHCGRSELDHDDVTILVLEVVDGPPGPALWHVLRNRVLRKLGLADDPVHGGPGKA